MHICVYERERGSVVGREGERREKGKEGEGGRGKESERASVFKLHLGLQRADEAADFCKV